MSENCITFDVLFALSTTQLIPVRVQIVNGKIYFTSRCEKGEMGEPESLELMENFSDQLSHLRIPHESHQRRHRGGKKTDCVCIKLTT